MFIDISLNLPEIEASPCLKSRKRQQKRSTFKGKHEVDWQQHPFTKLQPHHRVPALHLESSTLYLRIKVNASPLLSERFLRLLLYRRPMALKKVPVEKVPARSEAIQPSRRQPELILCPSLWLASAALPERQQRPGPCRHVGAAPPQPGSFISCRARALAAPPGRAPPGRLPAHRPECHVTVNPSGPSRTQHRGREEGCAGLLSRETGVSRVLPQERAPVVFARASA